MLINENFVRWLSNDVMKQHLSAQEIQELVVMLSTFSTGMGILGLIAAVKRYQQDQRARTRRS